MKRKDDSKDGFERQIIVLSNSFHRTRNSLLEEADSLYLQQNSYQASLTRCLYDLETLASTDSSEKAALQKQISVEIDFYKRKQEKFEKSCHDFFDQETFREDKPSNKLTDKKIIFAHSVLGDKVLYYFPKAYRDVLPLSRVPLSPTILFSPTTLLMIGTLKTITAVDAIFKSDVKKTNEQIASIERKIAELELMILEIQDLRIATVKKENSIMIVRSSLQSLTISSISRSNDDLLSDKNLVRHIEYASSLLKAFLSAGKTE